MSNGNIQAYRGKSLDEIQSDNDDVIEDLQDDCLAEEEEKEVEKAECFDGAYCIPLINTAEHSNCTVVIKRFGEQVKTLEVKWNSTIHLICDASCVGPRPQLGLAWLYRDKNQSKLINIKKLFPSPKFEMYPTKSRRQNELVIRDFGPNEETDFICRGFIKTQRLEAKVALIGTGSVQTDGILTIPDIQPSYAGNYVDTGTTDTGRTGSAVTRPDVEVKPAIEEGQRAEVKISGPGTLSIVDGGSVELTCTASVILKSLIRWRRREGPLPPGHSLRGGILSIPRLTVEYGGEYICSTSSPEGSYQASVFINVTGKSCEFPCRNGTCISSTKKCDGIRDCPDGDDEICDGAWSEWTNISHCYARACNISCGIEKGTCDKGQMEQIRFCNNPSPGYGGKWCHGQVLRIVECENYVQSGWSEWGPVTCDKDCRSSENVTVSGYRRRTCNNPPPIHEMDVCCGYDIKDTEEDSNICKDLPLCIYTTASTTATSSTTKVTCPPKEGFDYGYIEPTENAIKKDDDAHYDYSSCS